MQYMIYHKTGEKKVVNEVQRELLLHSDDWFSSLHEAQKAVEKDMEKVRETIKADKKKKAK